MPKLNELSKNSSEVKLFFVLIDKITNPKMENSLRGEKKKLEDFTDDQNKDPKVLCRRIKSCIKIVLKKLYTLNEKDYSYFKKAITSDKFFTAIKQTLNQIPEYSEITDEKLPLKWFGQYLNKNKKFLDDEYKKNDYEKLYTEMLDEEINTLNTLKEFMSTLIAKNGINLRCAEKFLDKMKYELTDNIDNKNLLKIKKFIITEKIEVCVRIKDPKDTSDKPAIIVEEASLCKIHSKEENDKKNLFPSHTTYIKDFIHKFSDTYIVQDKNKNENIFVKLIKEDIKNGERKNQIFKSIKTYMDIVKQKIKSPIINKDLFDLKDDNINQISETIEDHIIRQISKYIMPEKHQLDKKFEITTHCLNFVTMDNLEIKHIPSNQLEFPILCIKKMDEVKSVSDKLKCINYAIDSINNTIKFISGKDENAGQDETTPIFHYIVLKAHPKKMYSNINFMKTFLSDSELSDSKGFLLGQIESTASFIDNINYKTLNMSNEEFEKLYSENKNKIKYQF